MHILTDIIPSTMSKFQAFVAGAACGAVLATLLIVIVLAILAMRDDE